MDENTIIGRVFNSETSGTKDADGYWKVIVEISEKILFQGSDVWKEEKISAMGLNRDFDSAHQTALRSVLQWMESFVYSKGFNSLVDAKQAFRDSELGNVTKEPNAN